MASTTSTVNKTAHAFTREAFDELMKQRFFFTQAFEIYGGKSLIEIQDLGLRGNLTRTVSVSGVAGFYDYGPPGTPSLTS